jgi:hypothetical protein
MLHGGIDNAGALGFGAGPGWVMARVTRGSDGIAGNSTHE